MKIMKKRKQLLSLLLAVAFMVALPLMPISSRKASAAEPVTYIINYIDSTEQWRYQVGNEWNKDAEHRELYYMQQDMKDGDYLVVSGNHDLNLTVSVRLGNLTVMNSGMSVIHANGYDACYILSGSTAAINGDVTLAAVYGDNTRCTFNNNVKTLEITNNNDNKDASPVVTCGGTVGHLILHDPYTDYNFYNIAAGKLVAEKANITTDKAYYSTTAPAAADAPAATTPPAETATPPAATATPPAATPTPAPAGEYDDVPKTGDTDISLVLAGLSAVCLLAGYAVRKTYRHS